MLELVFSNLDQDSFIIGWEGGKGVFGGKVSSWVEVGWDVVLFFFQEETCLKPFCIMGRGGGLVVGELGFRGKSRKR
jgi:hypothetical protein